MSKDPTDLIAMSLEAVVERAGDPAPKIFARLFDVLPETEDRFARDTGGAIRGEMLAMVFDCLMDPGGPYQANVVRSERVNHDGFGTPSDEFNRFFWIVRDGCRELAGPDWTPEIDEAWTLRIEQILTATA